MSYEYGIINIKCSEILKILAKGSKSFYVSSIPKNDDDLDVAYEKLCKIKDELVEYYGEECDFYE